MPRTPSIQRDVLVRLYVEERKTCKQVAAELGVQPSWISTLLKRYEIPARSKHYWIAERNWKPSPEHRAKLTEGVRRPETREKIAASKRGAKSHLWRGGASSTEDLRMHGWEWKLRRSECYRRDGWTCQDCGTHCQRHAGPKKIQCHHVIRRRDGGPDDLENLVTLCMSCHHKREHRYAAALFA